MCVSIRTRVHRQRRCLDRAATAPEDATCLGLPQVPVTYLCNGDRLTGSGALIGRICTGGNCAELYPCLLASFLDSHHTIATKDDAPATSLRVPVLQNKRLQTGRDDPHAKPSELTIPKERLPFSRGCQGVNRPFCQPAHGWPRHLCSIPAYTTISTLECKRFVSS